MSSITILGTSHIAKQSQTEVQEAIVQGKPDIVAIELDRKRFPSLFEKKRQSVRFSDVFRVGVKGFLFAAFGAWAEKKLGDSVGVKPGAEMKAAVIEARKIKAKIALIDQDIEITLRRLSSALTWKEKWNFIADIFKGMFSRQPEFSFDLRTVPKEEIIKRMIAKLKVRYPSIHRVLIDERNVVMARNLNRIRRENPAKKIIAVVGAGHKEGLEELLSQTSQVSISYDLPKGYSLEAQ
jgi:pheromone shutdown-related protein TraB